MPLDNASNFIAASSRAHDASLLQREATKTLLTDWGETARSAISVSVVLLLKAIVRVRLLRRLVSPSVHVRGEI
jgi:hypothetical protein